jgi:surfeit locus 1 family protein
VWQIERRAWKLDLIAQGRGAHPCRAGGDPRCGALARARCTPIAASRATGTFLHDRERGFRRSPNAVAGFWVVTPLRTGQGMVLVNRGFVPGELPQARYRQDSGPVRVTGLLRTASPAAASCGAMIRANRWYSRDVAAIARARRLGRSRPSSSMPMPLPIRAAIP